MTDRVDPARSPQESASPPAAAASAPPSQAAELVSRGVLFALLAIPVGIAVWVLLWQWGFISAIAAFGVAWAALTLYRYGSGGLVSRAGFWIVMSITVGTLALSFLAGMAWDMASFLELDIPAAFVSSEFWWLFQANLTDNPDLWAAYVPDILLSVLFAALGTFSVFRTLAKQTSGTPELQFK